MINYFLTFRVNKQKIKELEQNYNDLKTENEVKITQLNIKLEQLMSVLTGQTNVHPIRNARDSLISLGFINESPNMQKIQMSENFDDSVMSTNSKNI